MTPTQRTLAALRADGWHVEVVEKWNPHTKTRKDLFGFADLLAIRPGSAPLLVQATSTGWANRIAKVRAEPLHALALASGFTIEVWGWRKLKTNKNRWTAKITPISEISGT
jgi:hypothetical protein